MNTKELNGLVYTRNCEYINNKGYSKDGVFVSFDKLDDMTNNTSVFVDEIDYASLPKHHYDTKFGVMWCDTLSACEVLLKNGLNPIALNMANRWHPCGGYYKGSGAQEESLCRQTTLSHSLLSYKGFYPMNERFGGIYSPNVQVFRSLSLELLDKTHSLGIVSVAALNLNPNMTHNDIASYQDGNNIGILNERGREIMKDKIRTILNIALLKGHDSVVLGAFGCGAFYLNVSMVVDLFQEVICESYYTSFKSIIFAIMDNNHNKFQSFVNIFGIYN